MRIGKLKFFEKRIIGGEENPLLVRWILFRIPPVGIFLHKLCRSDHERALHDHPWSFISIILKGDYDEIRYCYTCQFEGVKTERQHHRTGALLWRSAEWRHRVILEPGKTAWTLVIVFRNRRKWGFWPNWRWCWWRKYNADLGICEEEPIYPEQEE